MTRHQPLSVAEYNKLAQLKKNLGELLKDIRAGQVASVVAFSLVDFKNPINAVQLAKATHYTESAVDQPSCRDDASISSCSSTVLNSPTSEIVPIKQESVHNAFQVNLMAADMKSITIRPPPPPPSAVATTPRDDDEYEMYRVSINTHEKEKAHTRFRLFGIPGVLKLGRIKTDIITHVDRIPASNQVIKSFIMKEKDDEFTVPPTLNDVINISPITSTAIYTLVNDRNKPPVYPRREWTTEFLVNWEWWESKRFGRKRQKTEGYIVVLRGKIKFISPPPPPPGSLAWSCKSPKPLTVGIKSKSRVEQKSAAQIELTQQETENVINDFLATFSTLYDDVPIEERGAAMRGIDIDEMNELVDYDTDDSSRSRSVSSLSLAN
jgi:hypothetical protein